MLTCLVCFLVVLAANRLRKEQLSVAKSPSIRLCVAWMRDVYVCVANTTRRSDQTDRRLCFLGLLAQ